MATTTPEGKKTSETVEEETYQDKKSDFEEDPFIENPVLRTFGLAARVGRLLGTVFSKGSRFCFLRTSKTTHPYH